MTFLPVFIRLNTIRYEQVADLFANEESVCIFLSFFADNNRERLNFISHCCLSPRKPSFSSSMKSMRRKVNDCALLVSRGCQRTTFFINLHVYSPRIIIPRLDYSITVTTKLRVHKESLRAIQSHLLSYNYICFEIGFSSVQWFRFRWHRKANI